MVHCVECDNKVVIPYCGFEKVTKENYNRAFYECKDLKYYCKNHLPENKKSKPTHTILQSKKLPDEFIQLIENDLNKLAKVMPDYLEKKYNEIIKNQKYSQPLEFLIGWCIGTCETSYYQVYHHDYGEFPSEIQITEIRNIISGKILMIKQAILTFLEENNDKNN